uniref:Uncharacterized protein n=1 Tax=Arundo donax TaxID=35708 RepID=A0A0A9HF99_ARUDO
MLLSIISLHAITRKLELIVVLQGQLHPFVFATLIVKYLD